MECQISDYVVPGVLVEFVENFVFVKEGERFAGEVQIVIWLVVTDFIKEIGGEFSRLLGVGGTLAEGGENVPQEYV